MPQKLPNRQQPFEIKNKSATKAEIYLYGAIGQSWFEDSITAKQFSEELKKLEPTVKDIIVRINSPGGDVFEGFTIFNRLKQHPAKVTCYVDGMAASIASVIALAGDELIMGEGAQYMIHSPWSIASGNSRDFENMIDRLNAIEEELISVYAKKTKKSRPEIRDMLHAETWMGAEMAIEEGFADSSFQETMPIAASVLDKASLWIHKMPKNIKTDVVATNDKIKDLRLKIEAELARNKK
jgi:ATP-dependent protease ClpP protease subunit